MTRKQREELVDTIFSSILEGSNTDLLPFMNDNVEFHICLGNQLYSDSFSATFMGLSGASNFFSTCRQFIEFTRIVPKDFHHEDNKMIVRGDLECQMLTTGTLWTSSWMQIWTIENDKINKMRMFADYHHTAVHRHLSKKPEANISTRH
ncbi:MAG: nuclear transport factor 2 family protein [Sneathiella sp.]|nr:nuclear transport factor 2 family protein [Sneathiella sp.]